MGGAGGGHQGVQAVGVRRGRVGQPQVDVQPGPGSPGTGPNGRALQSVPPLSVISGSAPNASRTASAIPRRVPRIRCRCAAAPTASRSRSSGSVPSVSAPTQVPSHRVKSSGASPGVK